MLVSGPFIVISFFPLYCLVVIIIHIFTFVSPPGTPPLLEAIGFTEQLDEMVLKRFDPALLWLALSIVKDALVS